MDPLAILTAAAAYVGAEVARKCGSLIVEQTFDKIKALLKKALGRDPAPEDLNPETLRTAGVVDSPALVEQVRNIVSRSSALRRAQLIKPVLEGARILWVDDRPKNNVYECRTLAALGITVETALSTDEAMARVRRTAYDVILSDMARERPDAGLVLLRNLRESSCRTEVVFYVGQLDKGRGVPPGVFAITNQPEPLLHYVFDVLERHRV